MYQNGAKSESNGHIIEKLPDQENIGDEIDKKEEKEAPPPKVSLAKLWRYSSHCDLFLIIIGSLVSIITGLGFPFMSIVIGNISGGFINVTRLKDSPLSNITLKNGSTVHFNLTYTMHDFSHDVVKNCLEYTYIGAIVFAAAMTQVTCFLIVGENNSHRMRKSFFRSLLRQDISWFDKNSSGTLTSKMFEYDKALDAGKKDGIIKGVYIGAGLAATFLTIFGSYALAFWMGTNFVADGSMKPETVLTVFFSVMMGSMALGQAGQQFAVIGTAQGAAAAIFNIIDRKPEIDSSDLSGEKPNNIRGQISIKNIKFAYPTRPDIEILKGISLDAAPGQTVALVGSSGCGKSTIIQLLLRYYNPAEGSAYKTIVGERGTQLSGGQKQRIAIARALVRDPKILLLDEATSALDAESESVVQQALDKARQGRTTIVIAHRLSTIKNADKIIAMKNGQVVEVGTHESLIEHKGLYHELVNAQVFADVVEETPQKVGYNRQTSAISARSRLSSVSSIKDQRRGMSIDHDEEDEELKKGPEDIKSAKKRLKRDLEREGAKQQDFRKIFMYAKPEWKYLFIAVVASVVSGCVFPAFSLFFTQIMQVFSTPDVHKLRHDGHFISIMFLVLGAVMGTCLFCNAFFYGITSERLTMRLRSHLFRNIMRMDIAYFDMPHHSSGKISTRLATDAPNVKSALDYRLGGVFQSFVSIVCGVGIAFYYGWQMALLMIAIFPLAGVGQALQMKYFQGRSQKDKKDNENAGRLALEAIENVRTVQALTLEQKFYNMFAEFLLGPHKTHTTKALMQGLTYAFATSIPYFLYAAAFRFGLFLIEQDSMPPMHVMRVLFAISFTASTAGWAASYFPEYSKARLAAGIIFKMLGEKPKIDSLMPGGKKANIHGSVHIKSVHFAYPERPAVKVLQGLDLHVEPGQTLALVGPSGCGKSTVVSLLERFYDPLGGEVRIDGEDIRELNVGHVRSHIALVSQEPILFDCSIKENIMYGLDPRTVSMDQIKQACHLANIDKFIENNLPEGYETRVGEKGTQLSGGQKQRIAIARALIRNPKILLLDEATSALDTESESIVQQALDRASQGRTCIIIAHRLSTIVNADCIVVVKNGAIIEQGTHAELINKKGAYFHLTQKQNMKRE
uniref:p-glycoprotein n=1 Tax=Acrobeloides nanus TaxID=290746 RepID=A0A914DVT8_9BILA